MDDCTPSPIGKTDRKGYKRVYVGTAPDGRRIIKYAHRLAWEKKNGPIPDGMKIRHKCDNPPCINDDHLEIGTQGDNIRDMDDRGRRKTLRGEQSTNHKLTEAQAREILTGKDKTAVLAARFGVTQNTIRAVRTGQNWAHLQ